MNAERSNVLRLPERRRACDPSHATASALALHQLLADEFATLLRNSEALSEVADDDILVLANELADLALPVRKG